MRGGRKKLCVDNNFPAHFYASKASWKSLGRDFTLQGGASTHGITPGEPTSIGASVSQECWDNHKHRQDSNLLHDFLLHDSALPEPSTTQDINLLHDSSELHDADHMQQQEVDGIPDDMDNQLKGEKSTSGNFPDTGKSEGINMHTPFTGDFSASTWNTQALFAASTHKHFQKRNRARALILKSDFVCFQETHAQEGRTLAFKLPDHHCAIWANGTTRQAGIGIVLKHSFLRMFDTVDPVHDFEVIENGRAATLHLRGPYGNLDIVCVYLDATSSAERCRTMRKVGGRISPRSTALTVLAGDFNFVVNATDRWSTQGERWADNGDGKDTEVLEECILHPFGLHEWEQSHHTCDASGARARLDRIYNNQHISFQLDHTCKAYVEKWCPDLSAHRPIGVTRTRGHGKHLSQRPMQSWAFKHSEFAGRVQVEYNHQLHSDAGRGNAISRLLILKDAMKHVHDNIVKDNEIVVAESAEDQLGWALIYVRALESQNFERAARACNNFPRLACCGKSANQHPMSLHSSCMGIHMQAIRELVIELARENISEDLRELQGSRSEQSEGEVKTSKESILRKLSRLSPGEACNINCVVDDEGEHHSTPQDMARALCEHWQKVFVHADCDEDLLKEWLSKLFPHSSPGVWNTGLLNKEHSDWKVQKKHIKKAIGSAKCTMPGPDGIPAQAYKAIGMLAVDSLHNVFEVLCGDSAIAELTVAYEGMAPEQRHNFNESILCLLPKKPSGVDDMLGTYFHPKDTRPLNISNVDNRLLASAARLAWEPILEKWVSRFQRGFLKGRVMLQNVIDIDWNAMKVSLKSANGSLVLFDFKAAFPSVSHPFLLHCLKSLGLPHHAMNFISTMYSDNHCYIRLQGQDFPGFSMHGGVRQGCPLSPLLFAVCVDILLRMITDIVPDCTCKAFADDIAIVLSDWWEQGPRLERLFQEFERISNLGLNIKKTVCIPLWINGMHEVRSKTPLCMPAWSDIAVEDKGVYLGFVLGPGKGSSSWDKPLCKFRDRVHRWKQIGGGMQYAALAYNVFALSTLLYVAQLEQVPEFVLKEERKLVVSMFPGPGNWITAEDLWTLKEAFGFTKAPQSLALVARAAKFRVALFGCHFDCKVINERRLKRLLQDNIFSRHHELRNVMTILIIWGGLGSGLVGISTTTAPCLSTTCIG